MTAADNSPPSGDGVVKTYYPDQCLAPAGPGDRTTGGPALAVTRLPWPRPDVRIYVNGIQTSPQAHADTAVLLANLSERPVVGVYNATAGKGGGMALDLAQCAADWASSASAAVVERVGAVVSAPFNWGQHLGRAVAGLFSDTDPPPVRAVNFLVDAQRLIPEQTRVRLTAAKLGTYNPATRELYKLLTLHRGRRVMVVAHSQGNLITCDALWAYTFSFGEHALERVRVLSLASPAPAWPLGLRWRRLVYGHLNDPVPGLADPHNLPLFAALLYKPLALVAGRRTAGDWRTHVVPGNPIATHTLDYTIAAHDVRRNVFLLNFANRLRAIHGLPPVGVPADVR